MISAGMAAISTMAQEWITSRAKQEMRHTLMDMTFQALLRQEVGYFDTEELGSLSIAIPRDTGLVAMHHIQGSCAFYTLAGNAICGIVFSAMSMWPITAGMLIFLPCAMAVGIVGTTISQANLEEKAMDKALKDAVEDSICSVRLVLAFGLKDQILSNYSTTVEKGKT